MTTVLNVSPERFVSTPSVDRIAQRAQRYLDSGYSVHLRGPAGVGKTTLALHLAHLRHQPIFLIIGSFLRFSDDIFFFLLLLFYLTLFNSLFLMFNFYFLFFFLLFSYSRV